MLQMPLAPPNTTRKATSQPQESRIHHEQIAIPSTINHQVLQNELPSRIPQRPSSQSPSDAAAKPVPSDRRRRLHTRSRSRGKNNQGQRDARHTFHRRSYSH